ncbi:MAG: hypothetical protein ACK6CU_25840 [Deltaproteobacteria bacterium]|jgi:hypothetical protein
MHSFRSNNTHSNVVVGVVSLPAIGLLCAAFGLFGLGGLGILAGLAAFAAGTGLFVAAGALARRVGVRIEVDDQGIRAVDRGQTLDIRWADALTVSVEHGTAHKGTSIHDVRVDDGRGTVIEAKVPLWLGRAHEPGAAGALAILEREARVPLAEREARRGGAGRATQPARGTYASFPRTAWVALALGTFVLVPGTWLLVVDHFTGAIGPCAAFFVGCVGYAFFCWAWVGELELGERELRGSRRLGGPWSVLRHDILRVERSGMRELDSAGVTLVLRDGSRRRLARLAPREMRDRLYALAPS